MNKVLDLQSIIVRKFEAQKAIEILKFLEKYDIIDLVEERVHSFLIEEIKASYYRLSKKIDDDKEIFSSLAKKTTTLNN